MADPGLAGPTCCARIVVSARCAVSQTGTILGCVHTITGPGVTGVNRVCIAVVAVRASMVTLARAGVTRIRGALITIVADPGSVC